MGMFHHRFNGGGPDGRRLYFKGGGKGGGGGAGADGGAALMRQQEEERRARSAAGIAAIDNAFGSFNDDYFTGIADAFNKYQQPLFEEQVAEARRKLPMGFATTAGSAYQNELANLERDITRQQADLKNKGIDFANQQRGDVERNRADLVSLANSGTDASAIANQATARAQSLSKPPTFSPIADLFSKYTANVANINAAGQRGYFPQQGETPLLFGNRSNGALRQIS